MAEHANQIRRSGNQSDSRACTTRINGKSYDCGRTTGFVLEWPEQKYGALYISGDTVWFKGINEIARRFQIGTAILHIGKASFPITGPIHFTLSAKDAIRTVEVLDPHIVIPIHYEGWKHFHEPRMEAEKQFAAAGINDRVHWLPLGKPVDIEI